MAFSYKDLPLDRRYEPDYHSSSIPESIKKVKPVIFAEDDGKTAWCCIAGDNFAEDVTGCGSTPEEAMQNFDQNYRYFEKTGSKKGDPS